MKRRIIALIMTVSMLSLIIVGATVYGAFRLSKTITDNGYLTAGTIGTPAYTLNYYDSVLGTQTITEDTPGYDNGVLTCYASQKMAYNTLEYIQLNQLQTSVSYSSEISTRLRIKIQDSWKSVKIYTNETTRVEPIRKYVDEHFVFATGWVYDATDGYAYYQNLILPNAAVDGINCLTNSSYVLGLESGIGYRETIYIELQFQVEVVQANRASAVWGVSY